MYRKALLPIDGSELAWRAIPVVGRLLADGDGEVLVVQVVDSAEQVAAQPTPAGFEMDSVPEMAGAVATMVRARHEAAEEDLALTSEVLRRAGVANVTSRLVEGAPGPALVELAHEGGCDVVVMATHGRSGLGRALIGSVADYVVRHLTGIPVVLIHPEAERAGAEAAAPVVATA